MTRCVRILALVALIATSVPGLAAQRVRVAVLGLFHPKQLVIEASPSSPIAVEAGTERIVAGVAGSQRITVKLSGSSLEVATDAAQLRGDKITFAARDGTDAELHISVPGKLRRRYQGKLVIVAAGTELAPVIDMDIETAVASIVAAEMPADAPLEAMKAQAVVSRSYLVGGGHRHARADFCDTTHCQFLREPPSPQSRAALAARATNGLVLTWKGSTFPAMFSASCGGHTHSLAQVGYRTVDYPYYAVDCPYCRRDPERWSSRLSDADAAALPSHNESHRVQTGRRLGWNAVQSNAYTRTKQPAGVELTGVGRGHGIGLCQRGAVGMARSGKDFRAILAHYFPNTIVSTHAPH